MSSVNIVDYDQLMSELDRRLDKRLDEILFAAKYSDLPDFIKVTKASKLTGISARTINDMVNKGQIPAAKNGRHKLLYKADVLKLIKTKFA